MWNSMLYAVLTYIHNTLTLMLYNALLIIITILLDKFYLN